MYFAHCFNTQRKYSLSFPRKNMSTILKLKSENREEKTIIECWRILEN